MSKAVMLEQFPDYLEMLYDAGCMDEDDPYPIAEIVLVHPRRYVDRIDSAGYVSEEVEQRVPGPLRIDRPVALVTEDGYFLDGWHRLQKALKHNVKQVPVWVMRRVRL